MTGFAAIQSPEIDRKLFEPGGYVLYSSSKDIVVAPLRRQVLIVGAVAGLATSLCVLAGYSLVDRKILRPIAMLSQATRALAETVRLRKDPRRSRRPGGRLRHHDLTGDALSPRA